MRIHQNLCLALAVGMICTLPGCGSSDNPAPTTTTTKAALIGTLDGDLADNTALQFDLAAYTGDPSLPLIIGEAVWNDDLVNKIKATFDAGRPIALVYATIDEINALRRIVGFPGTSELPAGYSYADCYAIDRNNEGNIYEAIILPPPKMETTTEKTYTLDPEKQLATLGSTNDTVAAVAVTELDQQMQLSDLAAWIGNDATRDADLSSLAAEQALKAADTTLGGYNLSEIAKSTEKSYYFIRGQNRYQITNNVWSVYDATNKQSYFYVQQRSKFAHAKEYWIDLYYHKANFANREQMTNYIPEYLTVIDKVMVVTNAPKTYEGKLSVDDGIDFSLGGKLGVDLKDTATFKGELSGDVGFKHAVKYEIPDVSVINKTGTEGNDATWEFTYRWPNYIWTFVACWGIAYGPTPALGKGTFQPYTEWIWKVSDDVKTKYPNGLPIRTDFIAETAGRDLLGLSVTWCISHDYYQQTEAGLFGEMTVPWPTTTVNVNN